MLSIFKKAKERNQERDKEASAKHLREPDPFTSFVKTSWFNKARSHKRDNLYTNYAQISRQVNLEQCLRDFKREKINIDGRPLAELYTRLGYGDFYSESATAEEQQQRLERLDKLWATYLFKNIIDKKQRKDMRDFFSQYMHQGGYLSLLQTAMFQEASNKNVFLPSNKVLRKINFIVEKDKIIMENELYVTGYAINHPDRTMGEVNMQEGDPPIMVAKGRLAFSFDENKKPCCCLEGNVILEHNDNDDVLRSTFDERSLGDKIKEFLENIGKAVREYFSAKQAPQQQNKNLPILDDRAHPEDYLENEDDSSANRPH